MKLKFGHNNIELVNNNKTATDIKIGFSFNTTVLPNTKKHITGNNISKFDDLSKPGSISKLNNHTLLASLGNKIDFSLNGYISTMETIAEIIKNNTKIATVSLIIEETLAKQLNQTINDFIENTIFYLLNGLYYFDELKSKPKKLNLTQINIITLNEQKALVQNALNMADGAFLVRNLANNPANIVNPEYLAKVAQGFEKLSKKVAVDVLNQKDAKKLKMNAFLAVAQGADSEPKFIKMHYSGGVKNQKPVVLIGKGITFDSGGISLKPGADMDRMKYDMCGAATVIGIFQAVVTLELDINLICLVPSCENMPSGKAIKPGDIVTTMSGKTVEISNTDAEGRLILCDALTYAEKYKPELVIDLATLTGACVIALGSVASGLYSNNDELANKLISSGLHTNDKVWRMPLFKEYNDMLKGTVADLRNIGSWKGDAGSVTAACFLEQFTSYKWAHLDIAGTAMGGSGRPFYMMMHFLRSFKK